MGSAPLSGVAGRLADRGGSSGRVDGSPSSRWQMLKPRPVLHRHQQRRASGHRGQRCRRGRNDVQSPDAHPGGDRHRAAARCSRRHPSSKRRSRSLSGSARQRLEGQRTVRAPAGRPPARSRTTAEHPVSQPATICVAPRAGALGVGGSGLQSADASARSARRIRLDRPRDGHAEHRPPCGDPRRSARASLAVWYLPPGHAERSLLSSGRHDLLARRAVPPRASSAPGPTRCCCSSCCRSAGCWRSCCSRRAAAGRELRLRGRRIRARGGDRADRLPERRPAGR